MRIPTGITPRNPYNMIIQENHIVTGLSLLYHILLGTDQEEEEIQNSISCANHEDWQIWWEEKDHHKHHD